MRRYLRLSSLCCCSCCFTTIVLPTSSEHLPTHLSLTMGFSNSCILPLTAIVLIGSATLAQACSPISSVKHTFYGFPDNSPPGPATAFNCGGRNNVAGGSGTFSDPLTMATAPGEFNQCETVYVPYLKKYVRVEDSKL